MCSHPPRPPTRPSDLRRTRLSVWERPPLIDHFTDNFKALERRAGARVRQDHALTPDPAEIYAPTQVTSGT